MGMIRGKVYIPPLPLPQVMTLTQCQNGNFDTDLDAVYFHCPKKKCMYKQLPNGDLKFIRLHGIYDLSKEVGG